MTSLLRRMQASERRSAIVLLCAAGLALLAALEPLGGTEIPPAGPALRLPGPRMDALGGAYGAASPFDPARRPVSGSGRLPGEEQTVAEAAAPLPVLVLSGILVEGGRRKAMFSGMGDGGWQEAGSSVGDWVLEAVEPRSVRLRRGDEVLVMEADEALR